MKYTTTVEIDVPRERVTALFANPDHYADWMESLVGLERLDGEPGQVGTRTRLDHKMGKRAVTMTETVTVCDLPDLWRATYEADGVWNEAVNRFTDLDGARTRWVMDTEFRCKGIMWLMTTLMPGMFKKQTQATMEAFKAFAEGQGSAPPAEEG